MYIDNSAIILPYKNYFAHKHCVYPMVSTVVKISISWRKIGEWGRGLRNGPLNSELYFNSEVYFTFRPGIGAELACRVAGITRLNRHGQQDSCKRFPVIGREYLGIGLFKNAVQKKCLILITIFAVYRKYYWYFLNH